MERDSEFRSAVMSHGDSTLRTVAHVIERTIGRAVGVILGGVLACIGLAMGVTMVMLPLGVVIGFAGVLLIVLAISIGTPDGTEP
jgi:Mg/Co/Ni transporter MgtE